MRALNSLYLLKDRWLLQERLQTKLSDYVSDSLNQGILI